MNELFLIGGALLCIACAFLTSGLEVAFPRIDLFYLRAISVRGNKNASRLLKYIERQESILWTLLIANAISLFVGFMVILIWLWIAIKGVFLYWVLGGIGALCILYSTIDLLPKILFLRAPTQIWLKLVPVVDIIDKIFSPLAYPLGVFLRKFVGSKSGYLAFKERILSKHEVAFKWIKEATTMLPAQKRPWVIRVLYLERLSVGALTRPISKQPLLSETAAVADAIKVFQTSGMRILPVKSISNEIKWFIHGKDLLFNPSPNFLAPITNFLRDPILLHTDLSLSEALEQLYRHHSEVGFVVDRTNSVVGLLLLEDIVEFIFGELEL